MRENKYLSLFVLCMILRIISANPCGAGTIIELRNIYPDQLDYSHFRVIESGQIKLETEIAVDEKLVKKLSNVWIMDSTGVLVWQIDISECKINRHKRIASLQTEINLARGLYVVYYSISPQIEIIKKKKRTFPISFFKSHFEYKSLDRWGVTLESENLRTISPGRLQDDTNLVVSMIRLSNNQLRTRGISVLKRAKFEIYAVGEGNTKRRMMHDYGWIVNSDTRERIWEMDTYNSEHAGGAEKNLYTRQTLTLEPGNYIISFVTDDSHSFELWNEMPPYDPVAWGIQLRYIGEAPIDSFVTKYQNYQPEPVIEITRVRNNEFLMKGFSLESAGRVYIKACGEYSISRRVFVDYAWIVDAMTRETIWTMTYENTDHAGGHSKNRLFDDYLELDSGDYLVYYRSDESHAYRSWNERPPIVEDCWGIKIYSKNKKGKPFEIVPYMEENDPNILAQIIRVGDKSKRFKSMVLTDTSLVRVYAIGEGDKYGLYDYGWIEDEAGNILWTMNYKDSYKAGGARKNRLANDIIQLLPGSYRVYFETDGSHSYLRWNDSPPDDQIHWGITVIKLIDD